VRTAVVDVLLAAGVAAQLLCSLGVVLMRGAADRLHYAGAGTTVGPVLVGAAILVEHPHDATAATTLLTVALLVVGGSVLTTATARAVRARQVGRVEPYARERRGGA
jgi:multisubunit Na+/H+ antiporter MnhG subunit